ncbi:MAG: hypothetical protein HY553_05885 [Elusimicrobia bacterium]|nr:hypothetical protein [Elusimicrobiota bacterium]
MRDRLAVIAALFGLVRDRGRWWMLPIGAALLLIMLLALVASATPAAPLLYPLF